MNRLFLIFSSVTVLSCGYTQRDYIFNDPFDTKVEVQNVLSALPYTPDLSCITIQQNVINLFEAILIGLCRHPDTQSSYAEIEKEVARLGSISGSYLPSISIRYQQESTNFFRTTANLFTELEWVIFDFGERAANQKQSQARIILASATYDKTLQQRFNIIAENYTNLLAAEQNLIVAEKNVSITKNILDTTVTLHKEGIAIKADVKQARLAYNGAKLEHIQKMLERNNLASTLLVSIGYKEDFDFEAVPLPDEYFNQLLTDSEKLVEDVLISHPRIKEAQAKLSAANSQLEALSKAGMPKLVAYAANSYQPYNSQNTKFDNRIGLSIRWPIFEGFQRYYKEQELLAQIKKEKNNFLAISNEILLEVRRFHRTLNAAYEQRKVAAESEKMALDNYQMRLGRYQEGIGNLSELLQAQLTLNSTRIEKNNAVKALHQASLALILAKGNALQNMRLQSLQ